MLQRFRSEIRSIVTSEPGEEIHREALLRALERPGYGLHSRSRCVAGALTTCAYEAVAGRITPSAIRGAAGIELIMESAFMFDRVADRDVPSDGSVDASEELGLALTLVTLGFAASCEAAISASPSGAALQVVQRLFRHATSACAGQFLDLYWERRSLTSTDEALRIASLKSGSLGRMAAEYGAALATNDGELIGLLGNFGFNCCTGAQLMDDLVDACPNDMTKGDLLRNKKTLPVVFFRSSASVDDNSFLRPSQTDQWNKVRRLFVSSGAEVFCGIVAEAYRNRAREDLARLADRGIPVGALEAFLGSMVDDKALPHAVIEAHH